MEPSVEAQLTQIERDRMAVYLKRGKPSWWYLPAIGASTALVMAAYDLENRAVGVLAVIVLAAVVGALAGREMASSGAMPRFRSMPRELTRPLLVYCIVAALFVGGAWYVAGTTAVSHTAAGIAVGVFIWVAGWIVFRVTDARAERLARELGIRR